ncbi:MAG: c-type cytochrome [Acidimicrobiia bacterium]
MTRRALMVMALLLSACGSPAIGGSTDLTGGADLFAATVLGNRPGCITCHSLEAGVNLVGPSIAGIGSVAGSRVEGVDAEKYLRQSIVEPNAHIVEGYEDDVMPEDYVLTLTDSQIEALVEYMEGLR